MDLNPARTSGTTQTSATNRQSVPSRSIDRPIWRVLPVCVSGIWRRCHGGALAVAERFLGGRDDESTRRGGRQAGGLRDALLTCTAAQRLRAHALPLDLYDSRTWNLTIGTASCFDRSMLRGVAVSFWRERESCDAIWVTVV